MVTVTEGCGVKKDLAAFLGSLFLAFFCAGAVFAGEPAPAADQCPQAAAFENQVKMKRNEIKVLEDQIKTLRRAQKAQKDAERAKKEGQRQAWLESLKLTDPQKYEKEMAAQIERQKERFAARKGQDQEPGRQQRKTHTQWLEEIKTKNPRMYDLVVNKDSLEYEIKALRGQIQAARKACMPKK
jgi:hypothetical protein